MLKLLRTHRQNLGPLADADLARIQTASIAELDVWLERLFSANSLEELVRA